MAGRDWADRRREERDRSGAYWEEPKDYKVEAYKSLGLSNQWDNVRREPSLYATCEDDKNVDFIPDR